jgi:hypothetical protein
MHPGVLAMTEDELEANIRELGAVTGWAMIYHTRDSRGSDRGFPDLVMVNPRQRRILYSELKTETGKPSRYQLDVITILMDAGAEATIWRPRHWADGTIARIMRGERIPILPPSRTPRTGVR